MHRGEIHLVDLNPTRGAGIYKARPCVIVSNDDIGILPLKVVIPLIGHKPSHDNKSWLVPISPTAKNGLSKSSTVDALNISSVSDGRFLKHLGQIDDDKLELIKSVNLVQKKRIPTK
jgi:mRNA interferase MazF